MSSFNINAATPNPNVNDDAGITPGAGVEIVASTTNESEGLSIDGVFDSEVPSGDADADEECHTSNQAAKIQTSFFGFGASRSRSFKILGTAAIGLLFFAIAVGTAGVVTNNRNRMVNNNNNVSAMATTNAKVKAAKSSKNGKTTTTTTTTNTTTTTPPPPTTPTTTTSTPYPPTTTTTTTTTPPPPCLSGCE